MIDIINFISDFSKTFPANKNIQPWELVKNLSHVVEELLLSLDKDYNINNGVAVHKNAIIENGVVLKGPVIISENCFVGANAYIRGPVFLDKSVKIGPGCEIKQSVIFSNTAIAHFNYIGDSIIGSDVNFEAGSVTANHYNERADKTISVVFHGEIIKTGSVKFGSLVGDNSKIGANAVLSPGTILDKSSVVGRLELIDQVNGKY